jgi:hypothetical protein
LIAAEVVRGGESVGWAGTVQEREAVAELLAPFGISYLDDIRGAWVRSGVWTGRGTADEFANEYHRAAERHAELLAAGADDGLLRVAYARVLAAELAVVLDSRDFGWRQQVDVLRAELERLLR